MLMDAGATSIEAALALFVVIDVVENDEDVAYYRARPL